MALSLSLSHLNLVSCSSDSALYRMDFRRKLHLMAPVRIILQIIESTNPKTQKSEKKKENEIGDEKKFEITQIKFS